MKFAAILLAAVVLGTAIGVAFVAFRSGGTATHRSVTDDAAARRLVGPAGTPTALPGTWQAGLTIPATGTPVLISCLDTNHDGHIDAADAAGYNGPPITLIPGESCADTAMHADFFAGSPTDPAHFSCDAKKRPLLLVIIGGAGTDLLDPTLGESLGLLDDANGIEAEARDAGISTLPILTGPSVLGAVDENTSMEHWLEQQLTQRLKAMSCLRAVLIGHSHGAVTVTSVTADLDASFADRLYGVVVDRTTVLYDRPATDMPTRTPLLNIFQSNEGWHGRAINQPNVTNVDGSDSVAPIPPSSGGHGIALVTHKTIDDVRPLQQRIIDTVIAWVKRS